MGGSSEIDYFYLASLWNKVFSLFLLFLNDRLGTQQNILKFKISMSVPMFVHESDCLEELSGKGLHMPGLKTFIFIHFGYFVERGAESFEDNAKVVIVVETFDVSYYVFLIMGIKMIQFFDNVSLCFGRLYILFDWFNHLTWPKVTFIAYLPSLY